MKYINTQLLLFLFFILAASTVDAAKIYILFDPSCMDQLEFRQSRPDGRSAYYTYHVNIRSGEKLVLEVGEQGNSVQNYPPSPALSCQTGGFDKALVQRINSNIDEVYMVYPRSNKKYIVSPIKMASYYTKKGSIITYDSPKYRFRFDTENGTIGENIAVNNPGAKVYFEGRVENNCTGAYLFRQLAPLSAYPLIDLVLIPEIGIAEERSGANAAAAENNAIQLNRMNGKYSDKYLLEICGTEPGSQGSIVQNQYRNPVNSYNTYASRGIQNPPPATNLPSGAIVLSSGNTQTQNIPNQGTNLQPRNTTNQTAVRQPQTSQNNTPPNTHTVQSGETLYGISRKYNITVNDLKSWNGLTSNTIRRGQVLQVQSGQQAQVVTPPATTQSRGYTSATTLSGAPVPYQNNTSRINTSSEMHIVQPGETLASIALKYGYTAKKFREINGLKPNDYVKVGQRLKISDCNCPASAAPTSATTTVNTPPSVPHSYGSTGGRLTPNTLNARTPVANNTYTPPSISPASSAAVHNSGGLSAYSSATRNTNQARGGYDYDAIVPSAYDVAGNPAPQRSSLTNYESSSSASSNTDAYRGAVPSSYNTPSSNYQRPTISPYPTPNTPISYDQVQASPDSSQKRVHVVADGESLYGIARRYGTTPERLRQINNLGPNDPIISYQTLYLE